MRYIFLFYFYLLCYNADAALPFVTDDAVIQKPNQLAIETFSEAWTIPALPHLHIDASQVYGQYLSFSYGISKHLELTLGGMAGYDVKQNAASLMNPLMQLKTNIFKSSKQIIPSIAFEFGYLSKNGSGQYYDPATNYYALGAATSHFFGNDLIVHLNLGAKASYDILVGSFMKPHIGIGFDAATIHKDIRFIFESYNGAPNSPRDSDGYFQSYQVGFRLIKNADLSFHVLYGNQPSFADYNVQNQMVFRATEWVQFGIRKTIDELL
jgi:hypothetical protein